MLLAFVFLDAKTLKKFFVKSFNSDLQLGFSLIVLSNFVKCVVYLVFRKSFQFKKVLVVAVIPLLVLFTNICGQCLCPECFNNNSVNITTSYHISAKQLCGL